VVASLVSRLDGRLDILIESEAWDDTFEDAERRLRLALRAFVALTNAAESTEEEIRASIGLLQELIEGPGRRLVSILLAAMHVKPLQWLSSKQSKPVFDLAIQHGFSEVLAGFDMGLRNARAHESYVVVDDTIQIDGGDTYTTPDLVDLMLTAVESVAAMQFAVSIAAVRSGVDVDRFAGTASIGSSPEEVARIVLTASGWQAIHATFDGGRLIATGQAPRSCARITTAVSLFAVARRWPINEIELRAIDENGETVLSGPTEPLSRFLVASEEQEKGVATLLIGRRWMRDGTALQSQDHGRKWLAMQLHTLTEAEPRDLGAAIRFLVSVADDLDDPELRMQTQRVGAAVRATRDDLPVSPSEHAAIAFLEEWEKRRLDPGFE
jgi:hypothetical protein